MPQSPSSQIQHTPTRQSKQEKPACACKRYPQREEIWFHLIGSTNYVWLNNKPKMQEDCINHADTAGKKKKKGKWSTLDLFFFPLLLTATKQKTSRFKCYIKMSSKASPVNNTSEGKGLPEADSGFFVWGLQAANLCWVKIAIQLRSVDYAAGGGKRGNRFIVVTGEPPDAWDSIYLGDKSFKSSIDTGVCQ